MKNRRKAVQPFEIKKRKIDIFRNYEANGFEKNQRKFENFSTLISKKSNWENKKENNLSLSRMKEQVGVKRKPLGPVNSKQPISLLS
jgi:hypothetical protein